MNEINCQNYLNTYLNKKITYQQKDNCKNLMLITDTRLSLSLILVIKNEKNIYLLEKNIIFKNFEESLKFVNEVGKISEEEGHHPDIIFGWGYAKINITTHAIEGLSENDFILAAKIDKKINA